MEAGDRDTALGILALLGYAGAVGASTKIDQIPSSVGGGLIAGGVAGVVLCLLWLLSDSFREWEPPYYRIPVVYSLLPSPALAFELDREANLQAGGFDYLIRVWNHGPTKRFKATFQVPEGCPRNDRIYHDPTQTYWWEKAESTVSEIHTGEEDFFRIANQRTETLHSDVETDQYPNHQFSLFRYDDDREKPSHFCKGAYCPKTMDESPRLTVEVSVSSTNDGAHVAHSESFVVHGGGVEKMDQ